MTKETRRRPAGGFSYFENETGVMWNSIGIALQFLALVFLPMLVIWQLNFGFRLLWMPGLTLAGVIVFWIGHSLRQKT